MTTFPVQVVKPRSQLLDASTGLYLTKMTTQPW